MAVNDSRLPEYVRKHDLTRRMKEMADAGLANRLVLLFGAGFSKDARGYPAGAELGAIFLRELFDVEQSESLKVARKYELAAIAQQLYEKGTEKRSQLTDSIRKHLTGAPKVLSPAEASLGRIAS